MQQHRSSGSEQREVTSARGASAVGKADLAAGK